MATIKKITVKKNGVHRIGIWIFSVLFIVVAIWLICLLGKLADLNLGMTIALCLIPVPVFLIMPLYYQTWQITFDTKGIRKRLFWISSSHSWVQVKEVRSAWYQSEKGSVISITFTDGKILRFRKDCENADKAIRLIQSHCSIQGEPL